MIDGIKLVFSLATTFRHLWRCLLGGADWCSRSSGEVKRFINYRVLNIVLNENAKHDRVVINGSLHKFHTDGSNDTTFKLSQIRETIHKLHDVLSLPVNTPCIRHIEIGVNLFAKCPEAILDASVLYNGHTPTKIIKTAKEYYIEWEFTDYTIKLYKKGNSLLRFEVKIKRMRHLGFPMNTLLDLTHRSTIVKCSQFLLTKVDLFLFIPAKGDIPLEGKDRLQWAFLRNKENWSHFTSSTKSRRKAWVECAILNHRMIDWRSYLKKRIIQETDRILDVDDEFDGTFYRLEYMADSLAGANGSCERENGKKKTNTIPIQHCIESARDDSIPEDVTIFPKCLSFRSRGPPYERFYFLR